jgi:hypothetical protein
MSHTHEKINFKEAFGYGWEVLKQHWLFLLKIALLTLLITIPFSIIDNVWQESSYFSSNKEVAVYLLFQIVYWGITLTLAYNTLRINLGILHGHHVKVSQLFVMPNMQTLKFMVTQAIYVLMVIVGLIFFIIPGIYFGIKYFYATTILADKHIGILKAAEGSAIILKGEKWQMFAFLLVMMLCMIAMFIAGLVCIIIGVIPAIFIAGTIWNFAMLHVYKKLHA